MNQSKSKRRLNSEQYVQGILDGDRMILSRAITIIESNLASDKELSNDIIQSILPSSGKSVRIGITGVPGVGKSTFIEVFGKHLIGQGCRVAVLSIDPSSQRSKGSILGDKTRMEELSNMKEAYIRPSASGMSLGGVTNKTGEAMLLCEAAGFDVILVETVGVGQSEISVHDMTDFFILLMLSGAGDELQGIKKGIMEMADLIVINKADGGNENNSEKAKQMYQNALHVYAESASGWVPKVKTASSTENIGIDVVWKCVLKYKDLVTNNGFFDLNRSRQQVRWMYKNIEEELNKLFYDSEEISKQIKTLEKKILTCKISPVAAAVQIVENYKKLIQHNKKK